jgi:hypothetical protein
VDKDIKQELDDLKTKLDTIDGKIEKSARDSSVLTFAVVGFTIFMLGIAVWVQERMLTSEGNFFVIYGGAITVTMYFIQKRHITKTVKWLVPIGAAVLLVVLELIKYILTNLPTA